MNQSLINCNFRTISNAFTPEFAERRFIGGPAHLSFEEIACGSRDERAGTYRLRLLCK
jgi:hypothetical protein